MGWFLDIWSKFSAWINHLSPRQAAILGAVGLAVFTGIGKYFLVPLLKLLLRKTGQLIYPIVSGAFVLDEYIGLPKYLTELEKIVGRLRNPWLTEGQRLKDIFIPVSISSAVENTRRADLRQLFQECRAAIIIGDPGSGKTTGLKAIAMDCIGGRHRTEKHRNFVPVYIPLRDWAHSGLDFNGFLVKMFKTLDFPNASRLIRRFRTEGRLVFLLDGLDEVDDDQRVRISTEIRQLLLAEERQKGCRVYLASRPVAYQGQFSDRLQETVYMVDFTPAQIQQYISWWDFRPPKSPERLFEALIARPPILSICRNPLMLTIVTSLYRDTEYRLPESRDEFYHVCIEALLRRWDAVRELESRNRYAAALKEAFLQQLAFQFLLEGGSEMSAPLVLQKAEIFLKERNQQTIVPDAFVNEILRSGLLGALPTGSQYFPHKTFAEALAASYLTNRAPDLIACWSRKPDAWLEVCSLFVADPRCAIQDIELLLNNAEGRNDWRAIVILGGEAHTCPPPYRDKVNTLLNDPSKWPLLDKRVFAALSRLRNRTLLTRLVTDGEEQVRQLALYALGQVQEPWAIDLLVNALTSASGSIAATDALAGLGDDALGIIGDLMKMGTVSLTLSCIQVAEKIGSTGAFRLIAPLIWSENADVEWAAIVTFCRLLSNQDIRNSFDAGKVTLPKIHPSRDIDDLSQWAVPWVDEMLRSVRIYYAKLLHTLCDYGTTSWTKFDELADSLPTDILIATTVLTFERRGISHLPRPYQFESRNGHRLGQVVATLADIPPKLLRPTWSKAIGQQKPDVVLSEKPLFMLGGISVIIVHVPIVHHMLTHHGHWWLLCPIALAFIAGIGFAIDESSLETLLIAPTTLGIPRGILDRFRDLPIRRIEQVSVALLCFAYIGMIAASIYIAAKWRGSWNFAFLFGFMPSLIPIHSWEWVIVRRSNPFSTLRDKLAGPEPAKVYEYASLSTPKKKGMGA